jgi:iron complex outermembrane receptor protein
MEFHSMMLPKRSLLALAVAASISAQAQEATPQGSTDENTAKDDDMVESVLVIGQFQQSLVNRISVDSQELPFTLNVVDSEYLDDRNFTRPIEALATLPNISRTEDRQGTGGTQFLSRGFDAPILVDNRVQNSFRGAGSRDASFVERYEVLKGPASIANGPVGAGGIINTVTKSPSRERFTTVEFRADQYGSAGVDFDANIGELNNSDAFLLRVSGAYRDFQFDADPVEREELAIRPVAIFNLGDRTSAKASVAYTERNVKPSVGFPLMRDGSIPDGIDTDTFTGYVNSDGRVEDTLVNLELNHEFLDGLKLTARGSNQQTDFDYQNVSGLYNYSYTDMGLEYMYGFPQSALTKSEATFADIQLAYSGEAWGQQQSVVIGYSYDDRSFDRRFNTYSYDGPYSIQDIDIPRYGDGGSGTVEPFTYSESELSSVFAEAAIRPLDGFTIVAGIRYDDLVESTTNYRRGNVYFDEFDDSELTVRLGGSYEITERVNIYLSYAEAFVPQFGLRRDNNPVPAETSAGYEFGFKGSAFNDLLSFDAGIFQTDRENVALQDPSNAPGEFFVVSAGQVRVEGFELSSVLSPTDAFNWTFNFGYSDVEVIESGDDEIASPVFPELNGSSYLNYAFQSGLLEGLNLGGGVRYVGEVEGSLVSWDSYMIVDLNLGYSVNEDIDISFDILNIGDEKYVENTTVSTVNRLTGLAVLGAPTTAVLALKWRF